MKNWLSKLKPQSRKFMVMGVMVLLYIGNDLAGGVLSEQAMESIMALVIAWIVGQGIADHGAQGKANAIKRMKNETAEFQEMMKQILGQGTILAGKLDLTNRKKDEDEDDDEDDGPEWSDTTEEDEEDEEEEEGRQRGLEG